MNNVLLVGNGFDLAHGLLTKYEHFLYLMKNWDEFYDAFEKAREESKKLKEQNNESKEQVFENSLFDFWNEPERIIDKYIKNAPEMSKVNVDNLGNIIKNNSWTRYYCSCDAEIDGWIDFEREIYPVIDMFEFIFSCEYTMQGTVSGKVDIVIPRKEVKVKHLIILELWDKYFKVTNQNVYLNETYISHNYGILKKRILDDLRKEFEEFVEAFEIYLHEFVYKRNDVKILKQIKDIGADSVISFNYTLTEKIYGIREEDVHHLHGMIREDLECGNNNMVMGVSEASEQNMDFIYFVKYFQRIQRGTGTTYKKYTRDIHLKNEIGERVKQRYILHIYGHSLDETDEDILKYIIGKKNDNDVLVMKPKQVFIYYYNAADYEQKVINLIKLYGRDTIEENMEKELFVFIPTSNEMG